MRIFKLALIVCLFVQIGVVQAQSKNAIYLSRDEGESWHAADLGIPSDANVNALAYISSSVIAGTEEHGLFISTDGLKSWHQSDVGIRSVKKINALHSFNGVVFAGSYQHGILVSFDQGHTWTPANNGLEDLSIRCFFTKGNVIYAGTNGGVYYSTDLGKHWQSGFYGTQINAFVEQGGMLYASTAMGIVRSLGENKNWEWVWVRNGFYQIAAFGNEVVGVAPDGTSYMGTRAGTWIQPSKNFLPTSFRITPKSIATPIAPWKQTFKCFRINAPFRGEGLPQDAPVKKMFSTPYGVIAAVGFDGC